MGFIGNNSSTESEIQNGHHQFWICMLARNRKDIPGFFEKLCSYICEPRTPEQFVRMSELKEEAEELKYTNREIAHTLKSENVFVSGRPLPLNAYLRKFDTFSKKVLGYLSNVNTHGTVHAGQSKLL